MKFRTVGSLKLSLAGLGCNNFGGRIDEAASRAVVHAALDAGVTHFDTADFYGDYFSEEYLGRALGSQRPQVVISTKFGMRPPPGTSGGSPDWVARSAEASLRRLGTDWIDLYTFHQPDPQTPIADTLGALSELVTVGKVREIGCSNFSPAQLEEATAVAEQEGLHLFAAAQNEYSLLHQDSAPVLAACERLGIALVPFYPLARGVLTGKYRRGEDLPAGSRLASGPGEWRELLLTDERTGQVERLGAYAAARGRTITELALSWLAGIPAVASVIAGATTPAQVRTNASATTAWDLTAGERAEITQLLATKDNARATFRTAPRPKRATG